MPKKTEKTKTEEHEFEKEHLDVEKDVITEIIEEEEKQPAILPKEEAVAKWSPKTSLGMKVVSGEITDIDQILDSGAKILESNIVDTLVPGLQTDLLMVGQSKGKFGGGAKRIFRQTQKKTPEGNKPSFSCHAVVGDLNGHVGVGSGKSKDTVPAREKALRQAKLNVFKISRGCGSWECGCKTPHSIPFTVYGKCGSAEIYIMPAPKGKGLCIEAECGKILKLAGVKDCWSRTFGQTVVKTNLIAACIRALLQLTQTKVHPETAKKLGIIEGRLV